MSPEIRLRSTVATLAAAALFSGTAFAQMQMPAPAAAPAAGSAEPAKPEPDWNFSANIGLFSQYVFRGISQTNEKPAVQGGFDLSHKSGFYVGTWGSNISWISDSTAGAPSGSTASAPMEWDFYGGYRGSLPADFGYDLGVMYYWYPGSYPPNWTTDDTTELYAALSWKFLSLKYSYSVNNQIFGVPDSRGSQYLDLTASYDIVDKINDTFGKVTVFGHYGYQWFKGTPNGFDNSNLNYGDWKVGASVDVLGVTVGLYGTGTNANSMYYTNPYGKNISENQIVGYVQKTF